MNNLPEITFGIVNCNRLYYLKSCVESLYFCTSDYEKRQFIIVDNASVEKGTSEYLDELESRGFLVVRQKDRDPSNEFAKAANMIVEKATGEYVCILQGDMQFILSPGWLKYYIDFYQKFERFIGCIGLDAQRRVTNTSHVPYGKDNDETAEYRFLIDLKRNSISGAGDVMYSKKILNMIYPWSTDNERHEGGPDSETKMIQKCNKIIKENDLPLKFAIPIIPPAAAIYTDARGTNARVRGNKRYGDYWPPKKSYTYYEINDYEEMITRINEESGIPLSIEAMVKTVSFNPPIDESGSWKKNPINPETATESDYTRIDNADFNKEIDSKSSKLKIEDDSHIAEWLGE